MLQDLAGIQERAHKMRKLVSLPWALVQAGKCCVHQLAVEVQEGGICSL